VDAHCLSVDAWMPAPLIPSLALGLLIPDWRGSTNRFERASEALQLAFIPRHRYIARLGWAAGSHRGDAPGCPRACNGYSMPKLKTKSGAKKRFGRTASGKIVRNWGHKRHRLISKSKQGKRLRRGTTTMEPGDAKLVLTYMPYLRS
jgi:large subunit ribosomal protein L35